MTKAAPEAAKAAGPARADRRKTMMNIAANHRLHERYYSAQGFEEAAELRRMSNILKVLADRWESPEGRNAPPQADYEDPIFRAAACPDLNDPAAVTLTGILFMEVEGEPPEIAEIKSRLHSLARTYQHIGSWLAEKAAAGWKRESVLIKPETADLAHARLTVVAHTHLAANTLAVAGQMLEAACMGLAEVEFSPAALRRNLAASANMLRNVSYFMDHAALLVARQAGDLGLSDPQWTRYIAGLSAPEEGGK